jgi:anti-sigma factor RsiW
MTHWLHRLGGRGRRLAAYAAGELPPAERPRVEAALAACPVCRREAEVARLAWLAMRKSSRVSLTAEEAAAFLPAVNRRIDHHQVRATRPARPWLREILWDHPRLGLASAFTAALMIVALTLTQWGPFVTTSGSGVEVISVDVDEDASVMVFQAPGTSLKVIWVFDNSSS